MTRKLTQPVQIRDERDILPQKVSPNKNLIHYVKIRLTLQAGCRSIQKNIMGERQWKSNEGAKRTA
jgi:hypothetical protein